MKILICGDRNYSDIKTIFNVVKDVINEFNIDNSWDKHYIIHGCAKGADSLGGIVGKRLGFIIEEYPADWKTFGNSAGPRRNYQMLQEGKPDLVLAFHPNINNSKGTKHMISIAQNANIPCRIFSI